MDNDKSLIIDWLVL